MDMRFLSDIYGGGSAQTEFEDAFYGAYDDLTDFMKMPEAVVVASGASAPGAVTASTNSAVAILAADNGGQTDAAVTQASDIPGLLTTLITSEEETEAPPTPEPAPVEPEAPQDDAPLSPTANEASLFESLSLDETAAQFALQFGLAEELSLLVTESETPDQAETGFGFLENVLTRRAERDEEGTETPQAEDPQSPTTPSPQTPAPEDPQTVSSPPASDPPVSDPPVMEEPPVSDPPVSDPPVTEEPPASDPPVSETPGVVYAPPNPITTPVEASGGAWNVADGKIKPLEFSATSGSEIVAFRLANTGEGSVDGAYTTFGQVFVQGDVPAGSGLTAMVDGAPVALQMDVKSTYADGSVKHAMVTVAAPDIAAGGAVEVVLSTGASTGGANLTLANALAADLDVQATFDIDGGGTVTLDAASVLAGASSVKTWMEGPLASEFIVETEVPGTSLTAQFAIRVHADGTTRTNLVVQNDEQATGTAETATYDVTLTADNTIIYQETDVTHHVFSNWRKEAWSGGDEPDTFVVHDTAYMAKTGAISAYDTTQGVSASTISDNVTELNSGDRGLFDTALYETYMPATGGRGDLGLQTQWTSNYLVSQDEAAFEVMMAHADAAGGVQWHFIDPATGEPYSIDDHPDLYLTARGDTGWSVDQAHQPAMSYVPYLVTGDYYHWEELSAQANYNFLSLPTGSDYRDGSDGLLHRQQVRGLSWSLRTLSDAEFIAPDDDPLADYFAEKLEINVDYLVDRYVIGGELDANGELEGYIERYAFRPWMQDFLAMSLGQVAARGSEAAEELSLWTQGYSAGRFINGDNGFDPRFGAAYTMYTKDGDGVAYDTWEEAFNANYLGADSSFFSGGDPNDMTIIGGRAYDAAGYAAYSRAAMAQQITATGSAEAIEAYGFLVSETQHEGMVENYADAATFAIAPTLSNGTVLDSTRIVVSTLGNDTVTGTMGSELLHGDFGDDIVNGDGGMDLVFGGWGNDAVYGGAGDDFIFGNDGDDSLIAGAGTDYLKGNAGADRFVFGAADTGVNTVSDFDTSEGDALEIDASAFGFSTIADVLNVATTTADGVVLALDGSTEVKLLGASLSDLDSGTILLV